jgi:hypothetical protein
MFLQQHQTVELCSFAYTADREARSDLVRGYISAEDDYTSNFTGALRRIINSNSRTGLSATSFMVSPSIERRTGCDGAIILSTAGRSKIALFEAKLPLLGTSKRWDYEQTATGLSHYSDQLKRQAAQTSRFAIFEMFYCDDPFTVQPPYMPNEVSACIWHDDAVTFNSGRKDSDAVWSQQELVTMLQRGTLDIREILTDLCQCKVGIPLSAAMPVEVFAVEMNLEGHILMIEAD